MFRITEPTICATVRSTPALCLCLGVALRTYTSFSQAADENGLSRILVGIHFRHAVEEGIQHGRQIAKRAANLFLKPVH